MEWLQALVLGLVQGLTEFLPISSSGHISIVGQLLPDTRDPGSAFTAITQLGTELAVLLFFWRDILRIITRWFGSLRGTVPRSDADARMGWFIIIGSLPIGILGVLLQDYIDTEFRSLWITATMLIVFGVFLAVADRIGREQLDLEDLSLRHGIGYGLGQALALIPGVSRSGGTITMGLLLGYTREAATRYAFLLAIPAVFLSGLYKFIGSVGEGFDSFYSFGPTMLATLVAFLVGYAMIGWFLKFISHHSYSVFVWYRILLGLLVYLLLGTGVITA